MPDLGDPQVHQTCAAQNRDLFMTQRPHAEGQLREKMDFQQEVSDLLRVGPATFEVVMELLSVIRMS